MHKLRAISSDAFPPDHIVAMRSGGPLHWARFLADVASTRGQLRATAESVWALFESDSYRFSVGLFALLGEGKTVLLPAENHDGMVAALRVQGAAFLGEFPAPEQRTILAEGEARSHEPLQLTGSIVVFTSGSTGDAKPIAKTLTQLDAELAALELFLGERLANSIVGGTVSHQHFYGLLFSVLWPLCSGRPFWHKPFVDPVLMARALADFPAAAWVMSPAHLHRLGAEMPWNAVRDKATAVFSSGGPLQQQAAQTVFEALGQYPWEFFGSSETGAIAWRKQTGAGELWTTLPGVEVKLDPRSALMVRSAWLPDEAWYASSDLAILDASGRFSLGARIDRIVKVEGKRVSLPEVEAVLENHPWIEECLVLFKEGRRQYTAAAIALTPVGDNEHAQLGQHLFSRALRHYLGNHLAAAAVPRSWRVITELPRNSQGKIQQKSVQILFDTDILPPVIDRQNTANGCRLVLQIGGENPYFDGHFPASPVLPGVVQLLWAQQFAIKLLGLKGQFIGMRKIKFRALVFPEQEVTLSLEYTRADGQLQFHFDSARGRHSQGRLLYELIS